MLTFEKLTVWKKAHDLVLAVYRNTHLFPKDELYGLTSQLRRASISITANIVEGRARGSTADFLRFLRISRGSLEETEYLLLTARDLKYLPQESYTALNVKTREISAMLNALIVSLQN